jgi:hypothetical protein
MARLRDEADTAASDLKQARDFQSLVMQIYSNTPPISTLVSTTTITTSWDQGIVVGGWKTPSGKRVIVLVRLQPAGGPEHVSIESTTVEYTEEAGATTGLTQFNVDGLYTTKAHKLTAERMEAILRSAKDGNDGINIVATPIAQTVSEQEAEISVEGMGQTSSGEKSPARQVLDIVPTVAADGQSVHIVMTALLNYPIDLPPIETH